MPRKPPEDELRAIEALQSIHDRNGSANRVFADAMKDRLEKTWAESRGLKAAKSSHCIRRLLGRNCGNSRQKLCECIPPHVTNVSLWMKDGKPHCFVAQPNGLGMEAIDNLSKFCRERGLRFVVEAFPAFHAPMQSLFVVFERDTSARGFSGGIQAC